ncbi:MAG: thiamine phosphate synthase [Magnetococcus sp. WYHC-3]
MSWGHRFPGVYPILDGGYLQRPGAPDPEGACTRLAGFRPAVVQLRHKGSGAAFYDFAARWVPWLRRLLPDTRVVINDRVDLALMFAADGVHVGQDDLPVAVCRRLLGPGRLIGLSTHDEAEVLAAQDSGADYLGFGPIRGTTTKEDAQTPRGLAGLQRAAACSRLPLVAIGGLDAELLPALAQCGAAGAALISGLWQDEGALERCFRAWPMPAGRDGGTEGPPRGGERGMGAK